MKVEYSAPSVTFIHNNNRDYSDNIPTIVFGCVQIKYMACAIQYTVAYTRLGLHILYCIRAFTLLFHRAIVYDVLYSCYIC